MNNCVVFDFFYLYTDWFYWNTRRNTLIGCDASKNGILPLMEASSNQAIALGTPQTPFFDSHISEVRGRGTPFADMATPVRLSPSSKLCRTFRALLNFRMHKPLKDCVCIAHACVSAFRSPRPVIKLLKSITEIIDVARVTRAEDGAAPAWPWVTFRLVTPWKQASTFLCFNLIDREASRSAGFLWFREWKTTILTPSTSSLLLKMRWSCRATNRQRGETGGSQVASLSQCEF